MFRITYTFASNWLSVDLQGTQKIGLHSCNLFQEQDPTI